MTGTEVLLRRYRPNSFTADDVRAFWDSVADAYVHEDASLKDTHFQRFERAFTYVEPHDGMAALNIWSRNGEAVRYFRERAPGMRLVNAELSPRLIERARATFPGEEFVETDLTTLAFPDDEFDLVFSLETLEHVPDPLRFLREVYRVLKPGGTLVMSCPPATSEPLLKLYETFFRNHGEGPHRFLTSRRVKRLLEAVGFLLKRHEGTVFIPAGPRFLRRLEPIAERILGRTPFRELGIRQFYVGEKPPGAGPWQDLMRDVVDCGLCTRCGTCAGVCPESVFEFEDTEGACLPRPVRAEACVKCGACVRFCPGARVSFSELHAALGDASETSRELGPYRRLRIAQAADERVRAAGASGGVATALLCDLLERGEITGAVVLRARPETPWRPWPHIARSREEIIEAAQSKYCVTPTNLYLGSVDHRTERLAVVALPCQIHALRSLERHGQRAMDAVELIIGLYCGNQLAFGATRSFLRRHGVRDLRDVAAVRYRDGDWPGQVVAELRDGRSFRRPKFHFNHLISPYIMDRCLLCTDLAAEGADISVADAWDAPKGLRGGATLVVTRTDRGEARCADAIRRAVLRAQETDRETATAMHAHGFDLKKTGAFLRIAARARAGRPYPEYDTPPPEVRLRRRLTERLVRAHFALCRTRPARWLVDRIPFAVLGRLYDWARFVWKGAAQRGRGGAP